MYPACDVCLLDARVFRTFPEVAREIKRVRSSSGEVPVVFFLHFAYGSNDERTLWKRALTKVFGGDAANADSARQYHLSCEDSNVGLAVITLGTFPETSFRDFIIRDLKDTDVKIGEDLWNIEWWKWILDKGFRFWAASYKTLRVFYLRKIPKRALYINRS